MIALYALKALDLLKLVPREIWYLLAAFAAWWIFSAHYIGVGKDRCEADYAAAEEEARELAEESAGEARGERESDISTITTRQEDRDAAIDDAKDSAAPGAASNALNCERLRAAGRDVSQFPACRGRAN